MYCVQEMWASATHSKSTKMQTKYTFVFIFCSVHMSLAGHFKRPGNGIGIGQNGGGLVIGRGYEMSLYPSLLVRPLAYFEMSK